MRPDGVLSVLIAGPGADAIRTAAACLRVEVVAAENAESPDSDELLRIARTERVSAILPCAEPWTCASIRAAADMGLPGSGREAAKHLTGKSAMREALASEGVPQVLYRVATSQAEAYDAAEDLGYPLFVKPLDSFGGTGARRVELEEELPLAVQLAKRVSRDGRVILERFVLGRELVVEGFVTARRFTPVGVLEKEASAEHFCMAGGVSGPVELTGPLSAIAAHAVSALGLDQTWVHVELLIGADGLRVLEAAPYPMALRMPVDLLMATAGVDTVAMALELALGRVPEINVQVRRYGAVAWIPTRSGVVTEVRGVEQASRLPGVEKVSMTCRPGDIMRHIVDTPSRDRVGYAVAFGETLDAARKAAASARNTVEVVTRPSL